MTWTIKTDDKEDEALFELSEKMDLPVEKVFVQALRLYQAWSEGHVIVTSTTPSPGCGLVE